MPLKINKLKKDILSHKYFYITFIAVYFLAVIVGIIFASELERFFLTKNVIEFYKNVLTKDGSLSGLIFSRLFGDIVLFLFFFGFSFVGFFISFDYVIIFYRGYILGVAAGLFLSALSVSGLMLYIFAVLIPDLLTTVCLIFFATECFYLNKKKCKNSLNNRLTYLAVCWVVSLGGLLVEILFVLLFLRPLNFNF